MLPEASSLRRRATRGDLDAKDACDHVPRRVRENACPEVPLNRRLPVLESGRQR